MSLCLDARAFLWRGKGQNHLIQGLPEVLQANPKTRLVFAGDGELMAESQRMAEELGVAKAILFLGFVKNMDEFYAALDGFVFPAEFEGMGTTLQMAMANGIPAVSTVRGALHEVVEDGRTAIVAEPEAKAFAAAMVRLLGDRELREQLGRAAREEVKLRFSSDGMVRKTLKVYEDVLAQKARVDTK